jgi:hypothetical protein
VDPEEAGISLDDFVQQYLIDYNLSFVELVGETKRELLMSKL